MKNSEIGLRIMNLRMDRGYSRECLAELAGISSKFLFEIERRSKGISANTLICLADALEVSPDYIMKGRIDLKPEGRIAETLGKFETNSLEKIEQLLNIAYDIAHYN